MTGSPFDLSGSRAVVTGLARGIGQSIAVALARAGADVAGMDVIDTGETAGLLAAEERRTVLLNGSTAESADVERLADAAVEQLGGIDIWVNNAARMLGKQLVDTTDEDWQTLLATNLNGYFYGCRAAAQRMIAQGSGGRIVNVGSVTGIVGVGGIGAYAAAKGGISALTKAFAVEVAQYGITINTLAPGAIETPLNTDVYTPDVRRTYEARIPVGRLGVPDDVADAAIFLASPASRYMTGQHLIVDGGLIADGSVGHSTE